MLPWLHSLYLYYFTKLELNYNHLPVYIHCVHVCYVYTRLYGIYEPTAWKVLVAELGDLHHRYRPIKHVIHVYYKIHTSRSKPYKQHKKKLYRFNYPPLGFCQIYHCILVSSPAAHAFNEWESVWHTKSTFLEVWQEIDGKLYVSHT